MRILVPICFVEPCQNPLQATNTVLHGWCVSTTALTMFLGRSKYQLSVMFLYLVFWIMYSNSPTVTMPSFQVTRTQWLKSFPTTITSSVCTYTCKFEHRRTGKPCAKVFSRECDLRYVLLYRLILPLMVLKSPRKESHSAI